MAKGNVTLFYVLILIVAATLFISIQEAPYLLINTDIISSMDAKSKLDINSTKLNMDLRNQDDTSVADKMAARIRILCWVLTHNRTMRTKSIAVMRTWGQRCTSIYFMSDAPYDELPVVVLNSTEKGKAHLVFKSREALDYLYRHHSQDADWFLKADDDTYVIMENLRYLLDNQDPDEPVALGQQIYAPPKKSWSYLTGGAGYVISRAALGRFARREPGQCSVDSLDGTMEDIRVSWCLQACGVTLVNSTDRMGRQRFHHHRLTSRVTGVLEKWYYNRTVDPVKTGMENLSLYPVTFHHMSSADMFVMEATLYGFRRYGVVHGYHDVNQPRHQTKQDHSK